MTAGKWTRTLVSTCCSQRPSCLYCSQCILPQQQQHLCLMPSTALTYKACLRALLAQTWAWRMPSLTSHIQDSHGVLVLSTMKTTQNCLTHSQLWVCRLARIGMKVPRVCTVVMTYCHPAICQVGTFRLCVQRLVSGLCAESL